MFVVNKYVFPLRLHIISTVGRHDCRTHTPDNFGSGLQQTDAEDCHAESDAEYSWNGFPTSRAQFNVA